jgi:hypothetical protein
MGHPLSLDPAQFIPPVNEKKPGVGQASLRKAGCLSRLGMFGARPGSSARYPEDVEDTEAIHYKHIGLR